jgi:hypothetical protein
MARQTILARNGTDRLVVSTICTHFIFFHEAGFQFHTERRHGRRWLPTDEALQPSDLHCRFNQDDDPVSFGATPQTGIGFYKLSCDRMSIRTHCVDVVHGGPPPTAPDRASDVRRVRDVAVSFTYDGRQQTLRHRG